MRRLFRIFEHECHSITPPEKVCSTASPMSQVQPRLPGAAACRTLPISVYSVNDSLPSVVSAVACRSSSCQPMVNKLSKARAHGGRR